MRCERTMLPYKLPTVCDTYGNSMALDGALNDGSLFKPGEQDIYSSIYEYEHGGWVPGYQSFAKYDKDLDAVFVEFYSTTDPKLYHWNLSEIINSRIVKIIRNEN